ncbi:hypothetical protein HX056_00895 [Myroides odoratimimus]|uniref:Uncharacterized protein n=1 Tax=Myroides odoratimimus TaxID=76832 RepID=A0AAI8C242_9FLAO|nr:hypothetical protein [Myroides odoratimimus]ALU25248.1 hypothetical protein AS202_03345 [Myroides odoratimimus]MDM1441895.1 hypothetical protein [Myroides odoratimimus]
MAKIRKNIELKTDELLDLICDIYRLEKKSVKMVFSKGPGKENSPIFSIEEIDSIHIKGEDKPKPIPPVLK